MTQNETDIRFMHRCLQLASCGLGRVRPNPMVGCVIVKDGHIVSEGFHQVYGGWHAERNAILKAGSDLRGATLYVNLEPCSHQGLTPPCADLIVEKGIGRVVCCNDDPNPLVSGRGYAKLEAAGIEVVRHILEDEGRELNRRFFTFMEKRRPYIILKWAQSADGFMAPSITENGKREKLLAVVAATDHRKPPPAHRRSRHTRRLTDLHRRPPAADGTPLRRTPAAAHSPRPPRPPHRPSRPLAPPALPVARRSDADPLRAQNTVAYRRRRTSNSRRLHPRGALRRGAHLPQHSRPWRRPPRPRHPTGCRRTIENKRMHKQPN